MVDSEKKLTRHCNQHCVHVSCFKPQWPTSFLTLSWKSTHFLNFFPHLGVKKHPAELIWQVSPLSTVKEMRELGDPLGSMVTISWIQGHREIWGQCCWQKLRWNATARRPWRLFISWQHTSHQVHLCQAKAVLCGTVACGAKHRAVLRNHCHPCKGSSHRQPPNTAQSPQLKSPCQPCSLGPQAW